LILRGEQSSYINVPSFKSTVIPTVISVAEISNFRTAIREALQDWVEALTPVNRTSTCISISGVEYSPLEILTAVEHNTDLGKEFVAGLRALQRRMHARTANASVTDLIRRSVDRPEEADAAAGASH
jgi:hypothetical protein